MISADLAKENGMQPGGELYIDQKEDGIFIRRPSSHLVKVRTESTYQGHRNCRTCICNSGDEPRGQMTNVTFDGMKSDRWWGIS
jgi:hypothetical protein